AGIDQLEVEYGDFRRISARSIGAGRRCEREREGHQEKRHFHDYDSATIDEGRPTKSGVCKLGQFGHVASRNARHASTLSRPILPPSPVKARRIVWEEP